MSLRLRKHLAAVLGAGVLMCAIPGVNGTVDETEKEVWRDAVLEKWQAAVSTKDTDRRAELCAEVMFSNPDIFELLGNPFDQIEAASIFDAYNRLYNGEESSENPRNVIRVKIGATRQQLSQHINRIDQLHNSWSMVRGQEEDVNTLNERIIRLSSENSRLKKAVDTKDATIKEMEGSVQSLVKKHKLAKQNLYQERLMDQVRARKREKELEVEVDALKNDVDDLGSRVQAFEKDVAPFVPADKKTQTIQPRQGVNPPPAQEADAQELKDDALPPVNGKAGISTEEHNPESLPENEGSDFVQAPQDDPLAQIEEEGLAQSQQQEEEQVNPTEEEDLAQPEPQPQSQQGDPATPGEESKKSEVTDPVQPSKA